MNINEVRSYLGDGLYVEWDGYNFWLRANDHRDEYCTDKVCLEPSVLDNLNKFAKKMENNKK